MSNILECRQLTKVFKEGNHNLPVLKELDFTLKAGEKVAIVGASGSGKSTLLHILGCLDRPTQGELYLLDHPITQYTNSQLTRLRNQYIGFVYQFHHLLPEFTVLENIAMPLLIQGKKPSIAKKSASKIIEQLHLKNRAHHKPGEISGGERQRTAIGRAMITSPLFILADEPTGNLDQATASQIIEVLCMLVDSSFIIVTHDERIAQRMDRVLTLENGSLISCSLKQDVL